jgi:3-oxoacyl-[acyl-carrier protein] reductase
MRDSVAIITGASQGIGRATAIRLAEDFSSIMLVARKGEGLADTASVVKEAGAVAHTMELDLSDRAAPAKVIDETMKAFGRIDALINIAGAVPGIDLFEMTDDQWNEGTELKLHGARRLAIKAWDALKASKGSVIFMSGNTAVAPKPGQAAVATINAAINALSKAFAEKGIADGVQVNSISPGAIMTGRRKGMLEKAAKAKNLTMEEMERKFLADTHIERFGQPEEIAGLIAFLVSPAAKWMTGTSVIMDGGEIKTV